MMTSTSAKKSQRKNVIYHLRAREKENVWNIRRNCSIVKALVCQVSASQEKGKGRHINKSVSLRPYLQESVKSNWQWILDLFPI